MPDPGTFFVCALGEEPELSATLESLAVLREASFVYDGGLGPAGRSLLRSLGVRPAPLPSRLPPRRAGRSAALACQGSVGFLPPQAARGEAAARRAGWRVRLILCPGAASRALASGRLILGGDLDRVSVRAASSVGSEEA